MVNKNRTIALTDMHGRNWDLVFTENRVLKH